MWVVCFLFLLCVFGGRGLSLFIKDSLSGYNICYCCYSAWMSLTLGVDELWLTGGPSSHTVGEKTGLL